MEVPGLSYSADEITDALITKDVLLLVKLVDEEEEVLAWNLNTKERIVDKKFPAGADKFDQDNQQVMMGRNTSEEEWRWRPHHGRI